MNNPVAFPPTTSTSSSPSSIHEHLTKSGLDNGSIIGLSLGIPAVIILALSLYAIIIISWKTTQYRRISHSDPRPAEMLKLIFNGQQWYNTLKCPGIKMEVEPTKPNWRLFPLIWISGLWFVYFLYSRKRYTLLLPGGAPLPRNLQTKMTRQHGFNVEALKDGSSLQFLLHLDLGIGQDLNFDNKGMRIGTALIPHAGFHPILPNIPEG